VPRLRLGVALLIPPPVAGEIDGLRRACGDGGLGRIPAHLTLVPPVNVNLAELPRALAVLRREAAAVPGPIDVELGPVTTFAPHTPVVYLAVSGAVDTLQRLRDNVFVPPLARALTWPFVPHVTLADDMVAERIAAATVALADYRVGVTFSYITLLREGPPGRTWSPVADTRLGPPAVIGRGGLPVELWWSTMADPEVATILGSPPPAVPDGAEPFVVTARREQAVLGAARGWTRGDEVVIDQLVVTEAAGHEDVERHLRAAAAVS
jgi:2'-5' RNA ligase